MTYRIGSTVFQVICATIISMMAFPPGDIAKQVLVASSWFVAGAVVGRVWSVPMARS